MSVSAGTGGTTAVGVLVGGGAVSQGVSAPASVASSLPFTGASHITVLVAIALFLLISGALAVGLIKRAPDADTP